MPCPAVWLIGQHLSQRRVGGLAAGQRLRLQHPERTSGSWNRTRPSWMRSSPTSAAGPNTPGPIGDPLNCDAAAKISARSSTGSTAATSAPSRWRLQFGEPPAMRAPAARTRWAAATRPGAGTSPRRRKLEQRQRIPLRLLPDPKPVSRLEHAGHQAQDIVRRRLLHTPDDKFSKPGGQEGPGMARPHHPDDDHRMWPGPARHERQDFLALLVQPLHIVDKDRDWLLRRNGREQIHRGQRDLEEFCLAPRPGRTPPAARCCARAGVVTRTAVPDAGSRAARRTAAGPLIPRRW